MIYDSPKKRVSRLYFSLNGECVWNYGADLSEANSGMGELLFASVAPGSLKSISFSLCIYSPFMLAQYKSNSAIHGGLALTLQTSSSHNYQ